MAALAQDERFERITIARLLTAMGSRAFGAPLFLFGLPNAVPGPPLSAILGLPLLLFAMQMVMGWETPWLPRWLSERSIDRKTFAAFIRRALPAIRRIELLTKPRFLFLSSRSADYFHGGIVLILAAILILPIPGANLLPGLAVTTMALGMIERDGIIIVGGLTLSVFSLSLAATVIDYLIRFANFAWYMVTQGIPPH